MAVLQRSEDLVRYLIRDPLCLTEKNACGQTPLHRCSDWTLGTKILLDAGIPSDQLDLAHLTPLEYAISMSNGSDAAVVLLEAGCSLTCCDDHRPCNSTWEFAIKDNRCGANQWPLSPSLKSLIENIRQRRERLAIVAEEQLPQDVLEKARSLGTALDDMRAQYTWKALKQTRKGMKGLRLPGYNWHFYVSSLSIKRPCEASL